MYYVPFWTTGGISCWHPVPPVAMDKNSLSAHNFLHHSLPKSRAPKNVHLGETQSCTFSLPFCLHILPFFFLARVAAFGFHQRKETFALPS